MTASSRPHPAAGADVPAEADPLRVWFRFLRLHRRVSAAVAAELRAAAIPHEGLLNGITLRGTEAHGVEIRLISADG